MFHIVGVKQLGGGAVQPPDGGPLEAAPTGGVGFDGPGEGEVDAHKDAAALGELQERGRGEDMMEAGADKGKPKR